MSSNSTRINERLASLTARGAASDDDRRPSGRRAERSEPRKEAQQIGRLFFGDGCERKCRITDISVGGARVKFEYASEKLPEYVTLKFEATGQSRQARVAWQRDYSAGLSFQLLRPGKFTDFAAKG